MHQAPSGVNYQVIYGPVYGPYLTTRFLLLPAMPGGGRAGHKCVSDLKSETMYCVGGFSYTPLSREQILRMGMSNLPKENDPYTDPYTDRI